MPAPFHSYSFSHSGLLGTKKDADLLQSTPFGVDEQIRRNH